MFSVNSRQACVKLFEGFHITLSFNLCKNFGFLEGIGIYFLRVDQMPPPSAQYFVTFVDQALQGRDDIREGRNGFMTC